MSDEYGVGPAMHHLTSDQKEMLRPDGIEPMATFRLKRRSPEESMRYTLEAIREEAATKPNGGAWAAGMATLCLGTLY